MAVSAVIVDVFMSALLRVYARDVADTQAEWTRFKIGEGGRIGNAPKAPDVTLVDLESEGQPLGLPPGSTVTFSNGSLFVSGALLDFTTLGLVVGQWIKPGPDQTGLTYGSPGVPGSEYDEWGQIAVIAPTTITLVAPYTGASIAGRPLHVGDEPMYTFRKTLTSANVLWMGSGPPATTEVICVVASGEGNLDQLGNNPEYYEVGVFDANGVLVAYMTFDQQTKTMGVQLNNVIDVLG